MPRTLQNQSVRAATLGVAVLLGVLGAGCRREEIRAYRVPKEQVAAAPMTAPAAEPAAAPVTPTADWKIPAGWTEVAAGPMQQAKFNVGGKADVTLSIFPGEAGGLLININRWRGQVGLKPVEESAVAGLTQQADSPSGKLTVADMKSEDGAKRLVAAIAKRGAESWYFKLLGDAATVEKERDAFVKFSGDPR